MATLRPARKRKLKADRPAQDPQRLGEQQPPLVAFASTLTDSRARALDPQRQRGAKRSPCWDNALDPDPRSRVGRDRRDRDHRRVRRASSDADSTVDEVSDARHDQGQPGHRPDLRQGRQAGRRPRVEIKELKPKNWGWTAIIPGFGLLADEFPDPWLNISDVDPQTGPSSSPTASPSPSPPSRARSGSPRQSPASTPSSPRPSGAGTWTSSTCEPGPRSSSRSRVEGALFSVGDTHAAMGDGEVCGTAVETTMDIAVRLTVRKDMQHRLPAVPHPQRPAGRAPSSRATTSAPASARRPDGGGPGSHPRRRRPHRRALRAQRARRRTRSPRWPVDLRIHEIVDVPTGSSGCSSPKRSSPRRQAPTEPKKGRG